MAEDKESQHFGPVKVWTMAPKRVRWRGIAVAAALLLVAGLLAQRMIRPQTVTMTRAVRQPVLDTLATTGRVRGAREASLGFDLGGVIAAVRVREGDHVEAGDALAALNVQELDAALEQARTRVATAEADLQQAAARPLASERQRLEAQLRQAEKVGQANVERAQHALDELLEGPRSQEVARAEAELGRADAAAELAQSDLQRAERLYTDGAIAAADLDRARAALRTAKEQQAAAKSQVDLLRMGTRREEIGQARAALRAAEAEAAGNREAARQALATLASTPRAEMVAAARARVAEARAALNRAEAQRLKAALEAPFAGVVAEIPVEIGDAVMPGQTVLRLVQLGDPEIEVETDEQNLARLRPGQEAVVTTQAYPGRSLRARLTDLGARTNPDRGTVLIKLRPIDRPNWLRPDLTVDVNVLVSRQMRVLVPASAVRAEAGSASVLVLDKGRARRRNVVLGEGGPKGIAVLKGISPGALVIADPDVRPGARVRSGGD